MSCGCQQHSDCGCGPVKTALRGLHLLAPPLATAQGGLGFLSWENDSGGREWDDFDLFNLGYFDWFGWPGGGGGGYYGDGSGDFYYGGDYEEPLFREYTYAPFLPPQSQHPQNWWEPIADFFRGYRPPGLDYQPTFDAGLPPSPPECPPNWYYDDLPRSYHCAPIGGDPVAQRKARQQHQQRQQQQQQAKQQAKQPCQPPKVFDVLKLACVCPPRTVLDPRTNQCVRACPDGYVLDARTRQCVVATLANRNVPGQSKDYSWLLWLLVIAVGLKVGKNILTPTPQSKGGRRR